MLISGPFFETTRISAISAVIWYSLKNYLIFNFFKWKKKRKRLVDIGGPPRKCAYHAFIIQNLDVLTLELDTKVQFANFWQIEHTKISAVRQ
jgi:hypothetical protein